MPEAKKDIISQLQKDILLWQGFAPPPAGEAKGIGLGPLESAFPNGVFPTGTIHEMVCPTPEQAAATSGLMAGLLSSLMKQGGACLWISLSRKLFPPSLIAFDLEPDRMIFVDLQREKDVLWAMEEALKEACATIPVSFFEELIESMPRRIQACIDANGWHTKY